MTSRRERVQIADASEVGRPSAAAESDESEERDESQLDLDVSDFDVQSELQLAIRQGRGEHHVPQLFKLYLDHFHDANTDSFNLNDLRAEIAERATPKQWEAIQTMCQPSSRVIIFGSRKVGKTWIMVCAAALLGLETPLLINVLSSKKDAAKHIIWQLSTKVVPEKFISQQSIEKLTLTNGTKVTTLSNTVAGTGTFEADILIVDEAQEVEPLIWDKVIPQMVTGRGGRLFVAGTAKAGSRFEDAYFGEKVLDESERRFTGLFEFEQEDAPWVSEEEWRIVEALMSERMVRQELKLEWVTAEDVYFSNEMIEAAYAQHEFVDDGNYEEVISAWDWGMDHQTTNIVFGVTRDYELEEIETWGKSHPTSEEIKVRCAATNEKYAPKFIFESSPLGGFVRSDLSDEYNCMNSNFSHRKDRFILHLTLLFEKEAVHLKHAPLKSQLKRYCGDKKDDDWVDPLLHTANYVYLKYHGADRRKIVRRANRL